MEFIKPLIYKLKSNQLNDEDIKKAFESYTMLMIDLAFRDKMIQSQELVHDNDRLVDIYQTRIKRF